MTNVRYPRALAAHDLITVPAPSMGVPADLHARLDRAVNDLEERGFTVDVGQYARRGGLVPAPAAERRVELLAAFVGPARAVLPPWGGELAIELLEQLDWSAMAADPKWFVGWSDISTLLMPLTIVTGVATLHGANLMDEQWELPTEFRRWSEVAALSEGESFAQFAAPRRRSRPWGAWADEPLNRDAAYETTTGWRALGSDAGSETTVSMRGRLIGGCLETVSLLAGSRFGDVPGFARRHAPEGVIVYLEVAEADASTALRLLWSLRLAGWFSHATGILIGRTEAPDVDGLSQLEAVESALGGLGIPVIVDFDLGHQPPQMPLVNGALAEVELTDGRGRITQYFVP
ncbi:LD-carboxypeptidase [Cryobacterium adonitolivorans]|uniref:LD-carboxypeptidase n=1 Tax=Cryobacterium adonitolivorans TaxID=1259189 RepID=A0A4R8WFT0_9MICO|nr:S66 peptidase family protein [Cryobacterium adonitolivorans]TFC07068.1 LD-carboxypeptidase [Cryobacterium adonitolivorans]